MVTYEVSATVTDESLILDYEIYMKTKHLRDVLASGCFAEAILERAGQGRYRTRYVARNQDDVDRYLREHTAELRKDFAQNFPVGVQLSRDVWTDLVTERHGTPR